MTPETQALRIHDLLYNIEAGLTKATPVEDPATVFAGDITYRTDDGWTLVVFDDCNSFDFIYHVVTPEGERLDWDSPEPIATLLKRWRPPHVDHVKAVWGIPELP